MSETGCRHLAEFYKCHSWGSEPRWSIACRSKFEKGMGGTRSALKIDRRA